MNTPLDDWREDTDAQKTLSEFWLSYHGQQFQRVLEYLGRPKVSAVQGTGTEAAIQGGLFYQQLAGHFALLDQIPSLLPVAIAEAKKRNEAAAKVAQGRQLKPNKD